MAVPFRRKSSKKVRMGRSASNWKFQQKFSPLPLIKCANCQKVKLLHRICSHCWTYRQLDFRKNSQEEKTAGC